MASINRTSLYSDGVMNGAIAELIENKARDSYPSKSPSSELANSSIEKLTPGHDPESATVTPATRTTTINI